MRDLNFVCNGQGRVLYKQADKEVCLGVIVCGGEQ